MPIRQFLYRRAQGSPIGCCGLNLVRRRRAVLAAHVEFLEMKVEGADQFLLVFVLVRAMVSRDRAKCNLGTGGATAFDRDVSQPFCNAQRGFLHNGTPTVSNRLHHSGDCSEDELPRG
jgi:hypothetical protein